MSKKVEQFWTIEEIIKKRVVNNKTEYFVKWKDFSSSENTWEPKESFQDESIIKDYEAAECKKKKLPGNKTKVAVGPKKRVRVPTLSPSPTYKSQRSKIVKLAAKRANAKKSKQVKKKRTSQAQHLALPQNELASRTVDTIIGIVPAPGTMASALKYDFLIKFEGYKKPELVPRVVANELFEHEVVDYYVKHLFWTPPAQGSGG